jgi:hypothetical protein
VALTVANTQFLCPERPLTVTELDLEKVSYTENVLHEAVVYDISTCCPGAVQWHLVRIHGSHLVHFATWVNMHQGSIWTLWKVIAFVEEKCLKMRLKHNLLGMTLS